MGDSLGAAGLSGLLALLDIGGRPDRVKSLVQPEARIDVAREFVGLGDDGFERCADERVAVRLAVGQRPRVAAEERQVRSEFLAEGHDRSLSIVITIGAVFDDATRLLQPWKDRPIACALPPPEM